MKNENVVARLAVVHRVDGERVVMDIDFGEVEFVEEVVVGIDEEVLKIVGEGVLGMDRGKWEDSEKAKKKKSPFALDSSNIEKRVELELDIEKGVVGLDIGKGAELNIEKEVVDLDIAKGVVDLDIAKGVVDLDIVKEGAGRNIEGVVGLNIGEVLHTFQSNWDL